MLLDIEKYFNEQIDYCQDSLSKAETDSNRAIQLQEEINCLEQHKIGLITRLEQIPMENERISANGIIPMPPLEETHGFLHGFYKGVMSCK